MIIYQELKVNFMHQKGASRVVIREVGKHRFSLNAS